MRVVGNPNTIKNPYGKRECSVCKKEMYESQLLMVTNGKYHKYACYGCKDDVILPTKYTNIYFILAKEVNRVKIGKSDRIKLRLENLQTSSPVKLELLHSFKDIDSKEIELHEMFDKYMVIGEWFEYCEEIKQYIVNLKKSQESTKTIAELPTYIKNPRF